MADFNVTYVVSEKKVELLGTGTLCMGDQMAAEFEGSPFTLVSKNCSDVVLNDPDGKPMSIHTSLLDNRISVKVSYKGGSCGFSNDLPMAGHLVDCAKQKASVATYDQCMQGLSSAKVSAALRKVSAKLF